MTSHEFGRFVLVWVAIVALVVGGGAGYYTHATLTDTESASGAMGAADEFPNETNELLSESESNASGTPSDYRIALAGSDAWAEVSAPTATTRTSGSQPTTTTITDDGTTPVDDETAAPTAINESTADPTTTPDLTATPGPTTEGPSSTATTNRSTSAETSGDE